MERDYLEQTRGRDVDLIVCSDAEAILGIGDQGVGVSVSIRTLLSQLIMPRCRVLGCDT